MKRLLLTALTLFLIASEAMATRPSLQPSNLSITSITCHSLLLNWTNGNGNARLIVAQEGSAPTWAPSDYNSYSANANFGKGLSYSGAYVVYNGSGNVSFTIDSLKPGKTYYFTFYEHDNSGASTLYNITNPPTVSETTVSIRSDFKIIIADSCEAHNKFTFVNTSKSNTSGITYTYDFGDGYTSSLDSVMHRYIHTNGIIVVTLTASPDYGCPNFKNSHSIRIYPRKMATFSNTIYKDTQCLRSNYFELDLQPIVSQIPKSFTYQWDAGDGTPITTYKKYKHTYQNSGHYLLQVEITTNVNLIPTGCKDTLFKEVVLLPDPTVKLNVQDIRQCLKNNLFMYKNDDSSSAFYHWDFGDGQSSGQRNAQHSYSKAGNFPVTHQALSSYGCSTEDTIFTEVVNSLNSSFSGLDTIYCPSIQPVKLQPAIEGGTFFHYPVNNNTLYIPAPGNYTLSYALSLSNCKDTTTVHFRVRKAPVPNLGNDVLIDSSQSVTLDAGPGKSYLWNTSATTRTITINGATTPKGSKRYTVTVTDSAGCTGYDEVVVSVGYRSGISTPATSAWRVYPNPVKDHVTIENNTPGNFEWTVMDHTGKILLSGTQSVAAIDCSGLSSGLYILRITSPEGMRQFRFIKE